MRVLDQNHLARVLCRRFEALLLMVSRRSMRIRRTLRLTGSDERGEYFSHEIDEAAQARRIELCIRIDQIDRQRCAMPIGHKLDQTALCEIFFYHPGRNQRGSEASQSSLMCCVDAISAQAGRDGQSAAFTRCMMRKRHRVAIEEIERDPWQFRQRVDARVWLLHKQ